ncbi:uncharacterized protein K02A2.6-like [Toxorhynchites rutilus septentrionalis]|uniref:uncharacterized protein K02A2.6-like n=1 Tax=Toxorhynchites rutilus septentrionalis TaxID=329112 RepID=UPI0024798C85|nr:uncharacterized protein K02A2.6-like [Toxorhynchites rutilus septentrionalis]
MSKYDYIQNFPDLRLRKCEVKLKVISGSLLKIAGSIQVEVRCDDDRLFVLPLIIVDSDRFCPLMGRDWLDVLYPDWRGYFVHELCESTGMNVSVSDQMCDRERNKILFALNTKYRELFAENLQHPMEGFEANIVVRDHASPVFYKPYDVPFSLREKVSEELGRLVREDVLRSVQHSDWASPIVVVPKADGSVRICMDCKVTVNKVICNEHYPLPNINDVFANMSGYKYFAKLDLQGAYIQIKVTEKSQKFLVVNTHKGLYAFTRLPFGISSAASTFQRIMDGILTGIEGVQSYLDDIMIGSDTIEGLIATTYEVLDQLKKHKVKVNLSKSEFLVREIQYLGHKVSERGLSPSDEKVKAIKEAPRPRDVSQLKSFLGMINYYSKFVPNLSMKLSPLYALLKKNVRFEWNDQCEKVFSECKKLLLSHKLLALYNPELPIVIICDASSNGVGAVLCHKLGGIEKPVFYVSSTLSVSEKNYPNLHREALAVVFGLTKFFKYIYEKSFTVVTDNKPSASIFDFKKGIPSLTVTRLQKYVHMSIFDFDVLNSIFRIFGICGTIVSDNGLPFTSNAFSEYAKSMRIELMKSPAYSPESNGLAERAVQTAKKGIKKLLVDPKFNHKKLAEIVEIFLFSYRNSYSQAIDCTPASKVFSFIPKTDLESNLKPNVETIKKKVSFKEDVNRKKNHAKIESKFKVGDLVWYKIEIRSTRSWLETKIVGVNSTNTF